MTTTNPAATDHEKLVSDEMVERATLAYYGNDKAFFEVDKLYADYLRLKMRIALEAVMTTLTSNNADSAKLVEELRAAIDPVGDPDTGMLLANAATWIERQASAPNGVITGDGEPWPDGVCIWCHEPGKCVDGFCCECRAPEPAPPASAPNDAASEVAKRLLERAKSFADCIYSEESLIDAAEDMRLAASLLSVSAPRGEAVLPEKIPEIAMDRACAALSKLYRGDGGWIGQKAAEEQTLIVYIALRDAINASPPAAAQPIKGEST